MLGFKRISLAAALIYLCALVLRVGDSIARSDVSTDPFLIRQLDLLKENPTQWPLLIYGSSAVAMGLSAKEISERTGKQAFNVATMQRGGQLGRVIEMLGEGGGRGRVIVLSDRRYRRTDVAPGSDPSKWRRILDEFSLVPNVRGVFHRWGIRDAVGDFASYPKIVFRVGDTEPQPRYTDAHAAVVREHVLAAKREGMCPIVSFVPVLVQEGHVDAYVQATKELVARLDAMGIAQHVVAAPMVETDRSLFVDASHMSAAGRRKWTHALASEAIERDLCGLGGAHRETGS